MHKQIYILLIIIFASFSSVLSQYTNIRVSSPSSNTPEEVSIAINPLNPLNLVAGANISYYYYSNDGGYTWNQGNLSSTYGVWGDPSVIYDADGNAYFAHLSYPPSPGYWIDRMVVQKSTNGGQSWSSGAALGYNPPVRAQDKEWLAVDMTTSPYHNYIYIAWTQFDDYGSENSADSSRILFSRSTDAGITWSAPLRISEQAGDCIDQDNTVEGAVPAVGPNGEIYTCWAGPLGLVFDKSTDGGITWGDDMVVTSQPGGWDFAVEGIYRANGLPITACDISNSPYRGTVYIQWTDQRNGVNNTDVFIIKSTDGGETWGDVKQVNNDATTRQQFFSWMTVDQSNGYVYVCFYDRRNTIGLATDFYVAKSTDGGETFTNFKVSDTSFIPRDDVFFGDYTNIAALNGKVYPIWMRLDGTKLSVWTAPIEEQFQFSVAVVPDWNLVSVPLIADDVRKSVLFPSAMSQAFAFNGNYPVKDTLQTGLGYWVKFVASEDVQFTGRQIFIDTVDVQAKWNLIGTISNPLPTASINTIPAGIITSNFYTFMGAGYTIADTLIPGSAYWVKTNQSGKIILSSEEISRQSLPSLMQSVPEALIVSGENRITFEIKERSIVTLKIVEREGEPLVTLVDDMREAGSHQIHFEPEGIDENTYYYWLYIRPVDGSEREASVSTGKLQMKNN